MVTSIECHAGAFFLPRSILENRCAWSCGSVKLPPWCVPLPRGTWRTKTWWNLSALSFYTSNDCHTKENLRDAGILGFKFKKGRNMTNIDFDRIASYTSLFQRNNNLTEHTTRQYWAWRAILSVWMNILFVSLIFLRRSCDKIGIVFPYLILAIRWLTDLLLFYTERIANLGCCNWCSETVQGRFS